MVFIKMVGSMEMKKVLLIDSSEIFLESTSTILKMENFDVYVATNGEEAYQAIIEIQPDLVLSDIIMPGIDGFELLDLVRQNPKTKSLPFIFMTMFTEKSYMRIGMEKGADGFLPKPFECVELLSVIDTQFKKSAMIDEKITQKLAEVGKNLTYALPHEFRTPMNQIVFAAKYLNNYTEDLDVDDIKELADDILKSSNRLIEIIENYVLYSELIAISQNPEKIATLRAYISFEPGMLLVDAARNQAEKYSRSEDLIIEELAENLEIEMASDKYYMIVNELVHNAFKFSTGGTSVILKSTIQDDIFTFSIKDHGRGMTAEQIASIGAMVQFDRHEFEQQGMGLGLYIAKALIELHGGTLQIISKKQEGTEIIGSLFIHV